MGFEQKAMKVNAAAYEAVAEVKAELEREKQRQVTFSETVEYLIDYRRTMLALAPAAQEAGR